MSEFRHEPVMVEEVAGYLQPGEGRVIVDGTCGGGGHAEAIMARSGESGRLICIDRDDEALDASKDRLEKYGDRVKLVKGDFENMRDILEAEGELPVDGVLLDLGVSMHQLTSGERGFSFMEDGPLDMRMDQGKGISAAELIAGADEKELARIIREYGEEKFAKRVARSIVRVRDDKGAPETTGELKRIIEKAIPRKGKERIHPATRTFMALRIAVNRELEALENVLEQLPGILEEGGRAVVISYHSLEDRLVKRGFSAHAKGCTCPPDFPQCVCGKGSAGKVLTKRPLRPSDMEVARNPAARSAKLRAFEKSTGVEK